MAGLIQVSTFTPVQGRSLAYFPALYLTPIFGGREIAVLTNPVQLAADGSEGCTPSENKSSCLSTAFKIFTYILSLGIFPLLAILINLTVRACSKFHYIEEASVLTMDQMRQRANEYAAQDEFGDGTQLLDFITEILEKPDYQRNPQQYVSAWNARRGDTEEVRYPEDLALFFFKENIFIGLDKLVSAVNRSRGPLSTNPILDDQENNPEEVEGFEAFKTKCLKVKNDLEDFVNRRVPGSEQLSTKQIGIAVQGYFDEITQERNALKEKLTQMGDAAPKEIVEFIWDTSLEIALNLFQCIELLDNKVLQEQLAANNRTYVQALAQEDARYAEEMEKLERQVAAGQAAMQTALNPQLCGEIIVEKVLHKIDAGTYTLLTVAKKENEKVQVKISSVLFGNTTAQIVQNEDIDWRIQPTPENILDENNWSLEFENGNKVIFGAKAQVPRPTQRAPEPLKPQQAEQVQQAQEPVILGDLLVTKDLYVGNKPFIRIQVVRDEEQKIRVALTINHLSGNPTVTFIEEEEIEWVSKPREETLRNPGNWHYGKENKISFDSSIQDNLQAGLQEVYRQTDEQLERLNREGEERLKKLEKELDALLEGTKK